MPIAKLLTSRLTFLRIAISLFLSACQVSYLADTLFDTSPGEVLFQDDFSNPSSGWVNMIDEDYGILDYFDGYYRVEVHGKQQMLWSGPGLVFSDVQLEADAIKVIGSPDDILGLVCRAVDKNNYYFFVISSDGYYGIGKMIDGSQSLIEIPGMMPSELINQGKAINHLRADCIGDRLDLYINGQELASVNDSELSSGDVGVLAGNLGSSQTAVLFDNFSVINP